MQTILKLDKGENNQLIVNYSKDCHLKNKPVFI